VTVTVCDRFPLVAFTVALPEVGYPPAYIVRVDVAVPLGERVTVHGLMAQPVHAGHRGDGGTRRETLPENPWRLVTATVDVPVAPVWTCRLAGLAETVKSGVADESKMKTTLTACVRFPLVPVTGTV
jgi:hypothetical protein